MLVILCLLQIVLTYLMVLMANSCEIPAASKDLALWGGQACLCPKDVFRDVQSLIMMSLCSSLPFPFKIISSPCLDRMKHMKYNAVAVGP